MKIPTAAGTNSSVQATCAPTMNDQMPPNAIVPPVLVISCSPTRIETRVAFSAGSRLIIAVATSASSSAYAMVTGSSVRSTQNGRPSPMI
ncbi:MAG TPA: hypothetical protein VKH42_16235 [Vicinamibacterales bacterium]|nr:hypothetical protein [Vicinamibacterales bacterium]